MKFRTKPSGLFVLERSRLVHITSIQVTPTAIWASNIMNRPLYR